MESDLQSLISQLHEREKGLHHQYNDESKAMKKIIKDFGSKLKNKDKEYIGFQKEITNHENHINDLNLINKLEHSNLDANNVIKIQSKQSNSTVLK